MTKPQKRTANVPEKVGQIRIVDRMATDTIIGKKAAIFDAVLKVNTDALKSRKNAGPPGFSTLYVNTTDARQSVRP